MFYFFYLLFLIYIVIFLSAVKLSLVNHNEEHSNQFWILKDVFKDVF